MEHEHFSKAHRITVDIIKALRESSIYNATAKVHIGQTSAQAHAYKHAAMTPCLHTTRGYDGVIGLFGLIETALHFDGWTQNTMNFVYINLHQSVGYQC